MPVIAAGIVNKTGRIILSRQFTDITRIRIEGLLSAFPKLLSASTSKQYTVVETQSVRYVYQPIEELFLVVVTTKSSNIVEDLATLRLMGRLIPEYSPTISEESLTNKAFEILFAFDEVVTCGYRENVTVEQVISIMEMHSHEEEMALEEKRKAEADALRHAKNKAKELSAKRRENVLGGEGGGSSGFSAPSFMHDRSDSNASAPAARGFSDTAEEIAPKKATPSLGGMSLGKQRKGDAAAKVMQESGYTAPASDAVASSSGAAQPATNEPFNIRVEEKFSATLNRDGGASSVDVRGDLFVNVADGSLGPVKIVLGRINEAFNFKSHPNINKPLFTSDRVLVSKDAKPYPLQQSLGILRWRLQTVGAIKLPISVNCWPSESSVSVEFELENPELSLKNVVITIPTGGAFPDVESVSCGNFTHDSSKGLLHWQIPSVDRGSNDSGTLDVNLNQAVPPTAFFPTRVQFVAASSVSGVVCQTVTTLAEGTPVQCGISYTCEADEYVVA